MFNIEIDGVLIPIKFSQEFRPDDDTPYLLTRGLPEENIHYVLGNFNKLMVTSGVIYFFSQNNKLYSFCVTAICTTSKITTTTTWLYSVIFYEEEQLNGHPQAIQ